MVYINKTDNSFIIRNVELEADVNVELVNRFSGKILNGYIYTVQKNKGYTVITTDKTIPEKMVFDIYFNSILFNQLDTN